MGRSDLTNRGMYDREEVSATSPHAPPHLTNPSSTYHPRVGGANGHWPTLIRPIVSHTWCCIALATNFWHKQKYCSLAFLMYCSIQYSVVSPNRSGVTIQLLFLAAGQVLPLHLPIHPNPQLSNPCASHQVPHLK